MPLPAGMPVARCRRRMPRTLEQVCGIVAANATSSAEKAELLNAALNLKDKELLALDAANDDEFIRILRLRAGTGAVAGDGQAGAGAGAVAGAELIEQFKGLLQDALNEFRRELQDSRNEFCRELKDSRNVVSAGALLKLEHSMFAIIDDEPAQSSTLPEQHVCAGFFFREPGLATTANHCLPASAKEGDTVKVCMMATRNKLELTITKRNRDLDYALLRYLGPSNAQLDEAFLDVDDSMDALQYGARLALCACSIALSKKVGDVDSTGEPRLAVMPAATIRQSSKKHHLIYACQTFSGVCGSALVLHNSKLVGFHVMGVNELKERIRHARTTEDRPSTLEESLDPAIASVATGWIALLAREIV